jgi:hypothetical protein
MQGDLILSDGAIMRDSDRIVQRNLARHMAAAKTGPSERIVPQK